MVTRATKADAYRLLHEGSLALAEVEAAGMRIDVGRLDQTIKDVGEQIEQLQADLMKDPIWVSWRSRYGDMANMGSRPQLGIILLEEVGVQVTEKTEGGQRVKMNEKVLESLSIPFVQEYLRMEKLKKLKNTYLLGVRREVVDGLLHPGFSLHLVKTYRSSSQYPNFQNIPIRDKDIGKLIRQCFIPREGNIWLEADFSALEVRIAACYHQDPRMIQYIRDPSSDMHRDMASECYLTDPAMVSKDMRFYAKNQFVFPEFYGSYYINCAPNLWMAMERAQLKLADGTSLKDHLRKCGITELGECNTKKEAVKGTFEHHIKKVEQRFWGERFKVYADWKLEWYKKYLKLGGFPMLTGFWEYGVYEKNDVINHPVQGSAFHCLLWSVTELVKWLKLKKMKTVVIGQIHDSIEIDCDPQEYDEVIAKVREIMTKSLLYHWSWIIVPLDVEIEESRTNWFEKKKVAA